MDEYLVDDRIYSDEHIFEKIKNMSDEEFEQFLKDNEASK